MQDNLNFEDLSVGMRLKGTVRNVANFGAFVNIGMKNDGLVHISEISDNFVKHPLDILKIGEDVEVVVIGLDREKERVKLSIKQTQQSN